jgi:uncharacterized protein YdiU (UPF0061 family)
MDTYDPATVFSSIDRQGRYAYGNQPRIAHWNLTRLAEAMLPLLNEDPDKAIEDAQEALAAFGPAFERAYHGGLRRKLGLADEHADDVELASAILSAIAENQVDFTLFFRRLSGVLAGDDEPVRSLFIDPAAFDRWAQQWRARLSQDDLAHQDRKLAMDGVNPAFIPRNHQVEAMIVAAVERNDFGPFDELLTLLSKPYEDQPGFKQYAAPPDPHERVTATFCGT